MATPCPDSLIKDGQLTRTHAHTHADICSRSVKVIISKIWILNKCVFSHDLSHNGDDAFRLLMKVLQYLDTVWAVLQTGVLWWHSCKTCFIKLLSVGDVRGVSVRGRTSLLAKWANCVTLVNLQCPLLSPEITNKQAAALVWTRHHPFRAGT